MQLPAGEVPITVIILTKDEADNIGACLESLKWAASFVLLDSGSSDRTVKKAKKVRNDIACYEHPFTDFAQQRNWALDNCSLQNDWILFLDADERSTPEFASEVAKAIAAPGDKVGFFLCYRNFFLGKWIKHSTLFPSWQLRVLKRGHVRFTKEGHGQREVADGPLGYIEEPYDHYGFSKGVEEWIARHNSYSTDEVELIQRLRVEQLRPRQLFLSDPVVRRRALKRLAARSPFRPFNRFLYLFVWRRGFLDGTAGLILCLLRAAHEIHIVAKLAEKRRGNSNMLQHRTSDGRQS